MLALSSEPTTSAAASELKLDRTDNWMDTVSEKLSALDAGIKTVYLFCKSVVEYVTFFMDFVCVNFGLCTVIYMSIQSLDVS